MVRALLAAGGRVDLKDAQGNTPLMRGISSPKVVDALLKHGANPNLRNRDGKTALDLAKSAIGCRETLKILSGAVDAGRPLAEKKRRGRND